MKTKITKAISIILSIVFLLQMIPFAALAEEPEPQQEPETILYGVPEGGGYVPGEPELLEPDEPESGEPEIENLEAPIIYRDGFKVGIYNPNGVGTVEYKIGTGNWVGYDAPFYLPAYQTFSVSAQVSYQNESASTSATLSSLFEKHFFYTESVADFSFSYKTVSLDFIRAYRDYEWLFTTDSSVQADASGYLYEVLLPDCTEMTFVKVNATTFQNPESGYVLTPEEENNVFSGYSITVENLTYCYDSNGVFTSVQSVYGDTITLTRSASSIVVSDGANRSYTIALNAQTGLPVSITDPLSGVISYTYSSGKLTSVTDQSGVVIGSYQYDAQDRIHRSADTVIAYNENNTERISRLTKDSGAFENYTYYDSSNQVEVRTSTDTITTTVYNDAFEVVSAEDEMGYTQSYTYDSDYRLLTETADGVVYTTNIYDNNSGLLASSTDSEGIETNYSYDESGRLASVSTSDSEIVTTYSYTANGELAKTAECVYESVSSGSGTGTEALELVEQDSVTYVYDDGLLVETVDTENNETVEYTYDTYGNLTQTEVSIVGENQQTTTTTITATYDALGRQLTSTEGQTTTAYVYDAAGRTLRVTEGTEVTRTVYDALGRVVQVIGPEDYDAEDDGLPNSAAYTDNTAGTRYVYNQNGTLASETDRLGRTTAYTYNAVGSRVREHFDIYDYYYLNHGEKYLTQINEENYLLCQYYIPDLNTNTNTNLAYKLLRETYGNGDYIDYDYDPLTGNLQSQSRNGNNTPFVEYAYDDNNQLTSKTDYDNDLTYLYQGDTIEVRKTSTQALLYSYEDTTVQPEEGSPSAYSAEETHFGTAVETVSTDTGVAYTVGNNTAEVEDTLTNERVTQRSYSYNNTVANTIGYTYDADENITAQSYCVSGTNVTYGYTYDSENRLTAETMSGYTLTAYQYDAQGQLVRCTDAVSGFSFTYAYDSRGNITLLKCYQSTAADLTGITPIYQRSFSYQTSGWTDELTQTHMSVKGSDNNLYDYEYNSVLYDDIGNVTSYGNKSFTWENGRKLTSVTEGNNTYSYTYDEEGMRVSKTVGNTTTRFNYSGGQLLSQSDGTNTLIFQYDTSGNPAGFLLNGTQYFYVTDPQGNVTMLTDAQGNWVASYMYRGDAYGGSVFINSSGNGGNAAQLNPIRYKGYYYDAETGFYYLQSRYYDPGICRFINADVYCDTGTGTTLSTNMFAYCENDPVNYTDRFGFSVSIEKLFNTSTLSFLMYTESLSNKTWKAKYIFRDNQAIGMKLKNLLNKSAGWKNFIKSRRIKLNKVFYINQQVTFKRDDNIVDLDLHFSLGTVTMVGYIFRENNRKYRINVKIVDLYDFEYKDKNSKDSMFYVRWINNILGYYPQTFRQVTPYYWEYQYINQSFYI